MEGGQARECGVDPGGGRRIGQVRYPGHPGFEVPQNTALLRNGVTIPCDHGQSEKAKVGRRPEPTVNPLDAVAPGLANRPGTKCQPPGRRIVTPQPRTAEPTGATERLDGRGWLESGRITRQDV